MRVSRVVFSKGLWEKSRSPFYFYRPSRSGFSLIEIALAMGILTFALVGLLALFPLALDSAAESQAETRATQIAQSVFADIKASPLRTCRLVVGNDMAQSQNRQVEDLSIAQTFYLGYKSDGTCTGLCSAQDYHNGLSNKGQFLLRLTSAPASPGALPVLSTITLSVETPAGAPERRRHKYVFVTMKGE